MRTVDCTGAVALALLLLVPGAQAASLRGHLWFDDPASFSGSGSASASAGALSLDAAALAGVPLTLTWEGATGSFSVLEGKRYPGDLDPDVGKGTTWVDEPVDVGPGSLSGLACASPCTIALLAAGPGTIGITGNASGPLHEAQKPGGWVFGMGSTVQTPILRSGRSFSESPAEGAFASPGRQPFATGDLTLLLDNATGTLHNATGDTPVWTGRHESTSLPIAGVQSDYELRILRLKLTGARLVAPPGTPATLVAPSLFVDLGGSLASPHAEGWAEVDGARQELGGRSVRMEGTLALDVAPVDAMDGPHARPQDTLAPRDAGDLSGSGDLWLDGVAVAPALEAQAPAAAAALGGLVLLLILGLAVKTGALASLYTRVTRARVLENDSRRALFALIRERPGLHVSELARATGIGRVVLQHHLRMLEAHGLVVPRTRGRLVAYFSPGGVPGEQELAAKVALKDPTRRRVLDATASSGAGATQADIVEATALSQRLVSYHLARLSEVGLVRGDGGRPQRFHAVPPAEEAASP